MPFVRSVKVTTTFARSELPVLVIVIVLSSELSWIIVAVIAVGSTDIAGTSLTITSKTAVSSAVVSKPLIIAV